MDEKDIKTEPEGMTGDPKPDSGKADGKPENEGFTQADIDAAVKAALAENNKDIEARIKSAREEAEKLATMNAEERQKEEQRIERENFAKEKAALEAEKLKMFAERKLTVAGLPTALASTVAVGDEKTTQANIDALAETFNGAVANGVKAKLAGKTPHGGGAGGTASDKDKMKADIEKAMRRGF
ncbi:MAG: DUF4355 domain-containing protein [Oscillospiraceae bacterium]|nr:DUF4355 domain-containing protein [Oscillospiraceae bacterium]